MMTSFNSNVLFEMKESVIDTISDRDLLSEKNYLLLLMIRKMLKTI